jgi:hypothetical protein
MRRLCLLSVVLLAGCRSVIGPFAARPPERVDDPHLTIAEQQQRGRERLALPDNSYLLPRTYTDLPGPHDR